MTWVLLLSMCISCQKEPSNDEISGDVVVYTNHDTSIDFQQFDTYLLPDSILLIGRSDSAEYWKDENAQKIIEQVRQSMEWAGYTRTMDKEMANLGIQLSYVKQVTYYFGYDLPNWWWYYPYYWSPDFWGDWDGWFYPYPVAYTYTAGSMMVEMLNLDSDPKATDKLPIIWDAFIGGRLSVSMERNVERVKQAIEQAFKQSPYLDKNQR